MARVLIVDDSVLIQGILKKVLEAAGHTIVGMAASGSEAVRMYGELKTDLVTLDIVMEDPENKAVGNQSGIAALRDIREMDRKAIVVMVSSVKDPDVHKQAEDLGAAGFIVKAFKPEEVQQAVVKALSKRI